MTASLPDADLIRGLRAEIVDLNGQIDTWKSLVDHMRGVQDVPLLAVMADDDKFRVAMLWNADWGVGEWALLMATVVRHLANNADLCPDMLLRATVDVLENMPAEEIGGGRVM